MTMKKVTMLAVGAAATLGSLSAQAADKELLDLLLQNGAINQAQYNKLIKKSEISKSDISDVRVKLGKKGLQFETADKQFKFQLGGRIHADATISGNDRLYKGGAPIESMDGTELRRARMSFKGILWKDWKFMTEIDYADNQVAIKDMFLTYKGFDWLEITVGNQKQPISMEMQESSNDIMFTERSSMNGIVYPHFDRAIGIHFKSSGKNWSAQIGAYGDNPNKNTNADEGWGVASRITYTPIYEKTQVLHLGAFGGFRVPDEKGRTRLDAKPLEFEYEAAHMSNLKLTKTPTLNVDSFYVGGAEAAYMYGPFSVQGEYSRVWIERKNAPTLDFDGFYIQAGWTLTGESRSYKGSDGEFKRLKAAQHFNPKNGTWGAFELAARYDQLDLNSDDINGGAEKAVTVALNWYLNNNVRLMADYRRAFDVDGSAITEADGSQPENIDMFTLRAQLAF